MVDNVVVLERKRLNSQRLRANPEYRQREADYAKVRDQLPKRKTEKNRNQMNYALKRKFGITLADKEALFAEQGSKCAICHSLVSKSHKDFAIDHDHTTGKVRGVLCFQCNVGLGNFEDSVDFLKQAIDYLGKHKEKD